MTIIKLEYVMFNSSKLCQIQIFKEKSHNYFLVGSHQWSSYQAHELELRKSPLDSVVKGGNHINGTIPLFINKEMEMNIYTNKIY